MSCEVFCVCVLQCDVRGVKQSEMNLQNKMELVLLVCCGSEIFQSHQYHTAQLLLQKTVKRRFLKSFYNSAINVTHTTFISRTMRYLISFLMMPLNGESLELKYSSVRPLLNQYIYQRKTVFTSFPNTAKFIKTTLLHVVFLTLFLVFGIVSTQSFVY